MHTLFMSWKRELVVPQAPLLHDSTLLLSAACMGWTFALPVHSRLPTAGLCGTGSSGGREGLAGL